MRKLTGYIGALIIVFALMGSILAGYALNVNGSSSVINEYERVTDVSGLYTHSQEPSYIDYNPASNYIGYGFETSVYENTGLKCLKMIVGDTATITSSQITFKDKTYTNVDDTILWCHVGFLIKSGNYLGWRGIGHIGGISSFTITKSSETSYTIQSDFGTENWTNADKLPIFIYYPYDDYDSVAPYNGQMIYYNNLSDDIFYAGSINPAIPNGDERFVAWGTWGIRTVPGNLTSGTLTAPAIEYTNEQDVSTGVKQANVRVYNSITSGGVTYSYGNQGIFTNRYVYPTDAIGINYTETNRVNNYLINTDPGNTVINTATIDLMGITAGDLFPGQFEELRNALLIDDYYTEYPDVIHSRFLGPYFTQGDVVLEQQGQAVHRYSLYDVINTYTIPSGVNELVITANSSDIRNYTYVGQNYSFDMNMCAFFIDNGGAPILMYDVANKKDYVVYDIDNGLCKLYAYDGTLKGTGTTSQIGIIFVDNTYSLGQYEITYYDDDENITRDWGAVSMSNRARPFITVQSTTSNPANNHYMDITKGISIKSGNIVNTIWNNEYTNGNIQLLFRAEDNDATYHNDIIVGDNTISVDYTGSSYSVTLNNGDSVAVGKWRNIVLNIDLTTGELSAIPVRTFNSYTNVVLDTASIVIGDMVNPTPTNKIEWEPTTNSLMFNVYSTSVFMNTYGVVMVNPQLDITEYFTDLNGFYRMRLYNFTVLGSSITVNGVTADVDNNTITIDEQTVQIKDMAITYADGHAYISDSNVNIDLGEVVNNNISMTGAWYFETELLKGYTSQKMVYTWDWGDFILNNTQFCIMYIGIALIGLIVARRYCSLSITDYIVLIASFAIALTVQVVA